MISSHKFGDWSSMAECDKKLMYEVGDRTWGRVLDEEKRLTGYQEEVEPVMKKMG